MAKGGASMLQTQNSPSLIQALTALVDAEAMSSADGATLTALVQTSSQEEEQDTDEVVNEYLGAPSTASYEGHSDGIINQLEGLLEKANGQLDKARKAEQ